MENVLYLKLIPIICDGPEDDEWADYDWGGYDTPCGYEDDDD